MFFRKPELAGVAYFVHAILDTELRFIFGDLAEEDKQTKEDLVL
jgi:hypothetical protein